MDADVTVLGGGPAGASAALLLASWGHAVRVITKAGVDHSLAVSLPPSCGMKGSRVRMAATADRGDGKQGTESGFRAQLSGAALADLL